jgi:hypothetical protein
MGAQTDTMALDSWKIISVMIVETFAKILLEINLLSMVHVFITLKPYHKNKNLAMLRNIHGTKFFHIKLLDQYNIKCQNGPVLPPPLVFYFNGQALHINDDRC